VDEHGAVLDAGRRPAQRPVAPDVRSLVLSQTDGTDADSPRRPRRLLADVALSREPVRQGVDAAIAGPIDTVP